ncbi:sodium-coupled neutral amino acid transporter 9 homolog [Sycon ciliatum]|uniref:sodium-coupled neutral amino acid transporter 9 homolog n=1 Tax=Sycon ciliatum TaxID=27933 RepID=UPI0031F6741F
MDNVDEDERALVSSVPRGIQNVRYSSFTESHNIGDVSDGFSSRPILQQEGQSARGRFHKFGMPSSSQRSFDSDPCRYKCHPTLSSTPMDTSTLAHGSLVAILSLWGNMLGAACWYCRGQWLRQVLVRGIALVLVTSLALLYTCRLVVQRMHDAGVGGAAADFSAVCSCYLGKWGERACNVGMCLSDFCILTIHWMLLSNFSFYSVALAAGE